MRHVDPFLRVSSSRCCARRAIGHSEALEARRLLAATPLAISGAAGSNTFYLRENADAQHLDVWVNAATNGPATQSRLISDITTVTVNGQAAADLMTIDFSKGNPFPSTVTFAPGAGVNTLVINAGDAGASIQVNATTVTFGTTPITYSATQSITINGGGGNDLLTQSGQPNASLIFNGGGGSDMLNVNVGA